MCTEFHGDFSKDNEVLVECKRFTEDAEGSTRLLVQCAQSCRDWFDLKAPRRQDIRRLHISKRSFFALMKSLAFLEGFSAAYPSVTSNLKTIDAHFSVEFRVNRETQQIKDLHCRTNRCPGCAIFWKRESESFRKCPRDFCKKVLPQRHRLHKSSEYSSYYMDLDVVLRV